MRKIFIDTNIVIDLLSRRELFYNEAANLFSLADKKKIELSVSSLTIANTSYTLLRQKTANETKAVLRKLRLIIKILPLDDKIVGLALNDDSFSDFEDGLQYESVTYTDDTSGACKVGLLIFLVISSVVSGFLAA